ncbi:glyoxalase [Pseudoalteromonas citrea]|uniref:Glyoxalase n=2 Tax=Pseudoalteromonas citrea TaxID=43655 RepID=A0A5S3XRJ1_9GAMM|nr:VOC family protein [Pseudoalteromonas sp. MSK9-3]RJE77268.1 glyoxalase [Pseudoalteromonas sp. MSK9-3]TMP44662.1 glyoxalase [Pseudoalteromonas citrea]TMP59128.1 glyoxalase [Pseudoalteromonas citrea]
MKMNYCVFGTNDMNAAIKFYNALFEKTAYNHVLTTDRMAFWQGDDEESAFAVAVPFNTEEATNGNGTMVGFSVGSNEEVIRMHKTAIDLGGMCEGRPEQRGPRFSAYVRDLDNNKIAFCE